MAACTEAFVYVGIKSPEKEFYVFPLSGALENVQSMYSWPVVIKILI